MNKALNKKYRIAEIAAGIFFTLLTVLMMLFEIGKSRTIINVNFVSNIFTFPITIAMITGRFKEKFRNRAVGISYLVIALLALSGTVYAVKIYFGMGFDTLYEDTIKLMAASFVYNIILAAASVICGLTYLDVIKWKKRSLLVLFMYIFIAANMALAFFRYTWVYSSVMLILSLAFFFENSEAESGKGGLGRKGIWGFIIISIVFGVMSILSAFLSAVDHILEDNTYEVFLFWQLAVLLMSFAAVLLIPLVLFDKQFGIEEEDVKSIEVTNEQFSE